MEAKAAAVMKVKAKAKIVKKFVGALLRKGIRKGKRGFRKGKRKLGKGFTALGNKLGGGRRVFKAPGRGGLGGGRRAKKPHWFVKGHHRKAHWRGGHTRFED